MQITKKKNNLISIKSKEGSEVAAILGKVKSLSEDYVFTFGINKDEPAQINNPGEFEMSNIGLVALETKEKKVGEAELFKVIADGVNVLFVFAEPGDLSKDEWDILGKVDIVVLPSSLEKNGHNKLVKKLSPAHLILLGADEKSAEKMTDMKVSEKSKSFKFSEKDFSENGDTAATLLILE